MLERVERTFGSIAALAPTSLQIADGETLCVVGPSGSGKTTLLRIIAGLERADAGRVTIGGRDVTCLAPQQRAVGLVFADFALFPHLSVAQNIAFGAAHPRAVASAAERFAVTPLLGRRPATLSSGERQRVAIARVFASEPDVVLFDEPFANLDAPLRSALRVEFAELRAMLGGPAIFVTHDQQEALALGDRVAVMRDGCIVATGTPAALVEDPPTAFVAGFLGTPPANVIAGTVTAGVFAAGSLRVAIDGCADGPVTLAVRPDDVTLGDDDRARVRFVETIGNQRYATVAIDGRSLLARAGRAVRAGDRVGIHVDARRALRFDERGERLG